jgi:perosamine synthetase
MITIYNPNISKYKDSALNAIQSGWISNHGEFIEKATELLKTTLNVKHTILMSNGTCATHCLFLALKYKYPQIQKIYVPNNCYVAAWNCLLMEYDKTIIEVMKMDIDTWNINTDFEYIKMLDQNAAVLIVHNLGNIINVPRLKRIRPDIIFIEDNCEGFTGKYENIYSGTSELCLCSSISFYGNKIITTGEGGAFITNDDDIYSYILKAYSQGMSSIKYLHDTHAYNYRMTNIEAAFLFDQLNDFNNIVINKQKIFDNYTNLLLSLIETNKITLFKNEDDTESACWIFSIRLINNNKTIQEIIEYFQRFNIDIRPFFYPINKHVHLKDIDFDDIVPNILNKDIIMIPSSPSITFEEQKYVVNIITNFVNDIDIIEINNSNINLLVQFLSNPLPSTFRYFEKRNIDIIKNHIITLLLIKEKEAIGYAHIDYDKDSNRYWFGICILPSYHNKGYGNLLISNILIKSKIKQISSIYLTVDNNNIYAVKLYLKHNFIVIKQNEKFTTMLLNIY